MYAIHVKSSLNNTIDTTVFIYFSFYDKNENQNNTLIVFTFGDFDTR